MKSAIWKRLAAVILFTLLFSEAIRMSDIYTGYAAVAASDGESTYEDGAQLSELAEVTSLDGNISVRLSVDESKRYFYSVSNCGECVIYPSRLGLTTDKVDFAAGADYTAGEVCEITDEYTLPCGKHKGSVSDTCNELSFVLTKAGEELTVSVRVYDDGMAYSYAMTHGAKITSEASESILPDDGSLWSYSQPNVTYEGSFCKTELCELFDTEGTFTTPTLVRTGSSWMLLTEASVFDDDECYCSSYFETEFDSRSLKWIFGNKQSGNVVMENAFRTPWRVAVIGSDLNTIVNSDIVTSVCEDALDMDFGWVRPGKLAWSWWSSVGDDPVSFEQQFEYIDFAAANGWEYVCVDYGWVLWEDYKNKVAELVDYAGERGVGIWLWYGVNNVGHAAAGAYPKYSLLKEETIRTEMEWAHSIGVRGVKVDYYDSDNQLAMKQMNLCAGIAVQNQLMVLFHGCTNPGGENRTFPNVLSYEAIFGAEYYKWIKEPSPANIITYLFTRNAVGSADFTPTALPVAGIPATHGFMLATAIYVESGVVHFAENVNVYEGYKGLSLMNAMPVIWDETLVLDGLPGEYGSVARRSGEDWYIAALTTERRTAEIILDFLEDGREYTAYIYKTDAAGSDIEIITRKVSANDTLMVELADNDGAAVRITESQFDTVTDYEKKYVYLEAEKAKLGGAAVLSTNAFGAQYSSGQMSVEYIGAGRENSVTFEAEAAEEGVYEVNIFYISGDDRRFEICVNGDDENRLRTAALCSGDWVTVEKKTVYLRLMKGINIIEFYNDTAFAPNLDRISISRSAANCAATESDETEDNIIVSPGQQYEYQMYEAENGVIANGATKEGNLVGWLGGRSTLTFSNIKAAESGSYFLRIAYMTGEDRVTAVSVNGAENIFVECPSSGDYYSNPAFAYVEVELTKGENTIVLSNPSGYAPNIDNIGVSTERTDAAEERETVKKWVVLASVITAVTAAAAIVLAWAARKKRKTA